MWKGFIFILKLEICALFYFCNYKQYSWFCFNYQLNAQFLYSIMYEGHLESKERFAIKKYLLIIGKKKNIHLHLLLHIVTFDIEALVPWHQFTYSLLVPDGRRAIQPVHGTQRTYMYKLWTHVKDTHSSSAHSRVFVRRAILIQNLLTRFYQVGNGVSTWLLHDY
jgi:hypothetical protein